MNQNELAKLFNDVFEPKTGENVLILIDTPHDDIKDNKKWVDRREMAKEWYNILNQMGKESDFSVDIKEFKATGMHNGPIPQETLDDAAKANIVIAMTEFSGSSSVLHLCKKNPSGFRGISMPLAERRMEKTAFLANYQDVKKYATAIKKMLDKAIGAEVDFSTGDKLFIDLRNRKGHADTGEFIKPGQSGNFPSGEGYSAPYEAIGDEVETFGPSKTKGIWPVKYGEENVKFKVENNRVKEIIGDGPKAAEMKKFFEENDSRRNVAELGIGCNPKAVVTGNVLEDEKVGLHIAYGNSNHFDGKVESDMHLDIVYAKNCPIEGKTLTLIYEDKTKIELIQNAELRYDLLK